MDAPRPEVSGVIICRPKLSLGRAISKLLYLRVVSSRDFFDPRRGNMTVRAPVITEENTPKLLEHLSWQNDRDYHRLVAVYDMFLNRFPNNDLSFIDSCMVQSAHPSGTVRLYYPLATLVTHLVFRQTYYLIGSILPKPVMN